MAKQVIKFYANWCGPCIQYGPTFSKVKEELESSELTFIEVNVENDTENLAGEHKVRGIPHTVVIDNGTVRAESGRLTEDRLKRLINI
jgi:thioredoxin 1